MRSGSPTRQQMNRGTVARMAPPKVMPSNKLDTAHPSLDGRVHRTILPFAASSAQGLPLVRKRRLRGEHRGPCISQAAACPHRSGRTRLQRSRGAALGVRALHYVLAKSFASVGGSVLGSGVGQNADEYVLRAWGSTSEHR